MEIEVVRPGVALTLAGRLGVSTVADVRVALTTAIECGQGDLVVDVRGAEVVDATGLGVLVGAHRRAKRAGRRLVLRAVPERIERLLVATRLYHAFCMEHVVVVSQLAGRGDLEQAAVGSRG